MIANLPFAYLELVTALVLGLVIGLERSIAGKTAGMRTYGLVSMGSCLFVLISRIVLSNADFLNLDPTRMAAGIIMGIGFLCGGVIIFQNHELTGLTTAAGLWVAAGIGVASGYGQIGLAIFTTVITLAVFTLLWTVEHFITKVRKQR